ncbi:MAG: FtsB family cell division protein [Litorivicinus sp.]
MRSWVWLVLLGLLALLQYKWWLGQGGLLEQSQLRGRVAEQADTIATLESENALLRREVAALNTEEGLEEAARVHLGVKKNDEVFIRIAPGANASGAQ